LFKPSKKYSTGTIILLSTVTCLSLLTRSTRLKNTESNWTDKKGWAIKRLFWFTLKEIFCHFKFFFAVSRGPCSCGLTAIHGVHTVNGLPAVTIAPADVGVPCYSLRVMNSWLLCDCPFCFACVSAVAGIFKMSFVSVAADVPAVAVLGAVVNRRVSSVTAIHADACVFTAAEIPVNAGVPALATVLVIALESVVASISAVAGVPSVAEVIAVASFSVAVDDPVDAKVPDDAGIHAEWISKVGSPIEFR
jgi:hypothetical protein